MEKGVMESNGMTAGTQFAWEHLMDRDMEVDVIIHFLNEDFPIRTIKEELEKLVEEKAVQSGSSHDEIVKRLKKKCGDTNVNNWMNGKSKALTKESALKIAFALEMNYEEASWFLMQGCWLDGLYMRDYKDVIYRYCLDHKLDFEQAQAIIERHADLDIENPNVTMGFGKSEAVTDVLDASVKTVQGLGELDAYLEQNREYFGTFRRKAYDKFKELYDGIKVSIVDIPADIPTDEEICDFIAMGIPSLKGKQAIVNDVLKRIAEDALSRPTLSEIIGRQPIKRKGDVIGKITEVKRKQLLLFWLFRYNPEQADIGNDDKEIAFDECREDINNNLLEPCGMPLLDPRNPLDWVIMNAIRYAYFSDDHHEDDNTVARIHRIMALLFDRGDEVEDLTG